jgi:hypothetical protein
MSCAGHLTRMAKKNAYKVLVGKSKGMKNFQDLIIDGRIILK